MGLVLDWAEVAIRFRREGSCSLKIIRMYAFRISVHFSSAFNIPSVRGLAVVQNPADGG